MTGHEVARNNLGTIEAQSGNMERAVKHWMISASDGHYDAMDNLLIAFNKGLGVSKDALTSTLATYNTAWKGYVKLLFMLWKEHLRRLHLFLQGVW